MIKIDHIDYSETGNNCSGCRGVATFEKIYSFEKARAAQRSKIGGAMYIPLTVFKVRESLSRGGRTYE